MSRAPPSLQGRWDEEQSCRKVSVSHWQAPVSLHPEQKGPHWVQTWDTPSAGPRSFLAEDWNGVEGPGLRSPRYWLFWPVSLSQASLHRPAGPSGGEADYSLAKLLLGLQPAHGGHQDSAAPTPVFSLWNYG